MTDFENKFLGVEAFDLGLLDRLRMIECNMNIIINPQKPEKYEPAIPTESFDIFHDWYFKKTGREPREKDVISYLFVVAEEKCEDRLQFNAIFNNWLRSDWNVRKGLYHDPKYFLIKLICFPASRKYWASYEKTKYENVLHAAREIAKLIGTEEKIR